jgi:hypothetical protein
VTFDAVIFDNGRLLGDPSSPLATHFDALVQARQNVYRSVLDKLEAGEPADAVTKGLWPADELRDSAQLTTEWHAMNEARNTVATLLEKYGGEALAGVLRRALLPQSFVIHKRTLA